jgi:peptidoglycan lytic transglycosylase
MPLRHAFVTLLAASFLAGCATAPPPREPAPTGAPVVANAPPTLPAPTPFTKYYKDDGPGESPPDNVEAIPDAIPRLEALHRSANRPYSVLGHDYIPATTLKRYRERGIASWYGRKFHGQKTSIGETYDMYGMTAAHPTLPLPSYARVTNVATGKSVVVRVNDRGPFLHDRLIDLSYAAAQKLGIAQRGSGEVEVESIVPGVVVAQIAASPPLPPVASVAAPPTLSADQAPVESLPLTQGGGGFAVQLGAFANFANAQNFLAHVQNQLATAQVEPKVRQVGGLFRVYVGPYTERGEAQRVGERLSGAFGFATTIAPH